STSLAGRTTKSGAGCVLRLKFGFHSVVAAYAVLCGALAVAIALFTTGGTGDPTARFAWVAIASIVVTGSLVAIVGSWTATAVYAVVLWCFHFGLVVAMASGYVSAIDLPPDIYSWIFDPITGDAAVVALCGTLAFASGACLVHWRRGHSRRRSPQPDAGAASHPYGSVGSCLVYGALASWCAVVLLSGGPAGFFKSYEEFRQMTAEYGLAITIISPALACGIVMSVTGQKSWHRMMAIAAFVCFALVALPIGLRTDVMFPAVA